MAADQRGEEKQPQRVREAHVGLWQNTRSFFFDSEVVWGDGGRIPPVHEMLSPSRNDAHVVEAIEDFAWVTKPELPDYLDPMTLATAQRMLSEF